VVQDQSLYIYSALHEINVHLVLGSILASLVVLAFMRSWRSTLIAAVAIPASVISTFGMMWVLHFTLNSVTMLALVLMVGIVIDDAIVVLENIFRFVEEKGMSPFDAARAATADIGLAVMATTFSLVVIFIPVSFMSSISGRFLYQFGITAAVAVLVSLLVSFTLTPMMSARLLGADAARTEGAPRSRGGFYRWIDAGYERLLTIAMRHRVVVALVSVAVMLFCVTRATATLKALSVIMVVSAGVTRSLAPRVTLSSASSSATVALVVLAVSVLPSTATVTSFGVVTDMLSPARPSGCERDTESLAESARMPRSDNAPATVVEVVQYFLVCPSTVTVRRRP